VERTLTVQTMSGSVDAERRNGTSQSRYHGYKTGAHASDAAIGHTHASGEHLEFFLRSHTAVTSPRRTATLATTCGFATRSSVAKTGSLKRNRCT
jgi:hypothetical protein